MATNGIVQEQENIENTKGERVCVWCVCIWYVSVWCVKGGEGRVAVVGSSVRKNLRVKWEEGVGVLQYQFIDYLYLSKFTHPHTYHTLQHPTYMHTRSSTHACTPVHTHMHPPTHTHPHTHTEIFTQLQSTLEQLRVEEFTWDQDINFLQATFRDPNFVALCEVNDSVARSQSFEQPEGSAEQPVSNVRER